MPSMFYLSVPDVDAAYRRALQAGAASTQEPADQSYGARTAAVKDVSGNDAVHRHRSLVKGFGDARVVATRLPSPSPEPLSTNSPQ